MPNQDNSRRDFMKKSSIAVVGGAALLQSARPVHASGSDEIRIGLVGCGGRGTGAVRDSLVANKGQGVKLVAMGDAFEDRLNSSKSVLEKSFADAIDVPQERQFVGFDAYKQVLDCDIDMVILATPPGFRPIHFAAAVESGKHVFMEKPVAVDAPGVRQVLEAAKVAKEKKLGVGVGLQRRHQYQYIDTIKKLQDGAIGDIVTLRAYWNSGGVWVRPREKGQTEMEYQMRNWYYFNWLCGDHIVEQHIHNLDVCNWVKDGFPVTAQGMGGREVRKGTDHGQIYDHHAVEFTYEDGTKMFSFCRHIRNCWNSVSEHAHGSKGSADISAARLTVDGKNSSYRGDKNNPYQTEHADLVASIRAGNPLNEAEYGAKSTMTAIFGRMATYSGKELKWDDCLNSEISLAPKQYAFDAEAPIQPDKNGLYPVAEPGLTEVV